MKEASQCTAWSAGSLLRQDWTYLVPMPKVLNFLHDIWCHREIPPSSGLDTVVEDCFGMTHLAQHSCSLRPTSAPYSLGTLETSFYQPLISEEKRVRGNLGGFRRAVQILTAQGHRTLPYDHRYIACGLDHGILQALIKVHEDVIPHMTNPNLLADLLSGALDSGGMLGVLALHAIFVLATKHGLEYPQFYARLYQLLQPSALLVRNFTGTNFLSQIWTATWNWWSSQKMVLRKMYLSPDLGPIDSHLTSQRGLSAHCHSQFSCKLHSRLLCLGLTGCYCYRQSTGADFSCW